MSVATVLRGVLVLPGSYELRVASYELLDIGGRRVLALHSGANDVSRLPPGVYFIREQSALSGQHSGTEHGARDTVHVRKVVLQR